MPEDQLSPELEDDRRQLREIMARAEALAAKLDDETGGWRPSPDRWSVAQCLAHLNAASRPYLADLTATVQRARERGVLGDRPPKRGWFGRWFINTMEPPVKRRFRAPKAFAVADSPNFSEVYDEFQAHHRRFEQLLVDSNGLDLWKVRMPMSAFKLLRMSIGEIYAFTLAHERRHLWQAEQVLAHPDFPAATATTTSRPAHIPAAAG